VTYIYTYTHIYTQIIFYAVRKFYYFDKKKARNYHNSERESSVT